MKLTDAEIQAIQKRREIVRPYVESIRRVVLEQFEARKKCGTR